ncbi:MAG: hypothetical protein DMF96_15480 [Acidobacteria bacterium]|nr:MAG: hypothetical protein DMF96_15480 [Acidobacteriota bacterium]
MRIYRWLLWLSPPSWRREYGGAMEETFALRIVDARAAGIRGRARLWRRELVSLVALAITERWASRRVRALDTEGKAQRMDAMAQEIRHAARRLRRSPAFTVAAVLTLALAIGANASIFAVVHRVLLNPLPYGDPERLIALDYAVPGQNVPSGLTSMSWQLYHQLSDHARTLEGVAAYDTGDITVTGNGDPERIRVSHATPSLAPTLRVSPALGRWFTGDEGVPGGPDVVVLSHGFWVRRHASDRDVLGHRVILNGVSTEVVGVMPPSFAFPEPEIAVWLPARSTRASATFLFLVAGVARLRDRATLADARSEITNLIGALSRVSPNQRGITSTALPLRDSMVGRVADMLWILLASVGLVLLVGCANVANLFLVRSEARQREVAVRRAIGANNSGIARYFLAESALLSIAGAAVGLLLAWGAVRLLALLGPSGLPRLEEVRLDGVVVSFTVALSILATFALAAIPLVRIVPLTVSLHDTGRGQTASRRRHRARQVLMASQIAFALVLLVGSGLMVRSFQKLRAVNPGFNAPAVTFRIGLPGAHASGDSRPGGGTDGFHDDLAGHCRCRRAAARRRRHLRRHVVHRRSADGRNRRETGAGCRAGQRCRHDRAAGRSGGARRDHPWTQRRAGGQPPDGVAAVRCQPSRSHGVRRDHVDAAGRSAGRVLAARPARRGTQSIGSVARRVARPRVTKLRLKPPSDAPASSESCQVAGFDRLPFF